MSVISSKTVIKSFLTNKSKAMKENYIHEKEVFEEATSLAHQRRRKKMKMSSMDSDIDSVIEHIASSSVLDLEWSQQIVCQLGSIYETILHQANPLSKQYLPLYLFVLNGDNFERLKYLIVFYLIWKVSMNRSNLSQNEEYILKKIPTLQLALKDTHALTLLCLNNGSSSSSSSSSSSNMTATQNQSSSNNRVPYVFEIYKKYIRKPKLLAELSETKECMFCEKKRLKENTHVLYAHKYFPEKDQYGFNCCKDAGCQTFQDASELFYNFNHHILLFKDNGQNMTLNLTIKSDLCKLQLSYLSDKNSFLNIVFMNLTTGKIEQMLLSEFQKANSNLFHCELEYHPLFDPYERIQHYQKCMAENNYTTFNYEEYFANKDSEDVFSIPVSYSKRKQIYGASTSVWMGKKINMCKRRDLIFTRPTKTLLYGYVNHKDAVSCSSVFSTKENLQYGIPAIIEKGVNCIKFSDETYLFDSSRALYPEDEKSTVKPGLFIDQERWLWDREKDLFDDVHNHSITNVKDKKTFPYYYTLNLNLYKDIPGYAYEHGVVYHGMKNNLQYSNNRIEGNSLGSTSFSYKRAGLFTPDILSPHVIMLFLSPGMKLIPVFTFELLTEQDIFVFDLPELEIKDYTKDQSGRRFSDTIPYERMLQDPILSKTKVTYELKKLR